MQRGRRSTAPTSPVVRQPTGGQPSRGPASWSARQTRSRLIGRSRSRSPVAASTAFAAALAIVLGYASLVDVSNVVILSGYALTCLAALVLRVRRPEAPRRYRPALVVPVLAFSAAIALLVSARPKAAEWRFAALLLGAGFACWTLTGLARRILAPRP